MNCVQIRITSSGTLALPGGSTFPGSYTSSTPGIVWNIYDKSLNQSTYSIPGAAGGQSVLNQARTLVHDHAE
ncbi:lytic polysaccharide monooxygenase [Hypholoma sublateritium FD-334 SS-4]|uniref:AA9 family lytic polysaccharide monooxygenase n=1 Tax=Hypholoma sublateritium (strain FD-334 SS-4) TaxID=945553 RepID=A0A0D2LKB7_HYPSF|nr:lytic polysaccharide monooxygenase [Hypholoma sublateritium FD-334 SS-4]